MDYAILQTDILVHPEIKGAKFGHFSDLSPGDKLVVIGSPLGLSQTVTEGIVSSKRKIEDAEYLQMSASISPGSSGSPVFNSKGDIVGLVVFHMKEGQSLNFAISSSHLEEIFGFSIPDIFNKQESRTSLVNLIIGNSDEKNTKDSQIRSLQNLDDLVIMVEDIPDGLNSAFSRNDIENFVSRKIKTTTSDLIVLTNDEQKKKYSTKSDSTRDWDALTYLGKADQKGRYLYVSISHIKTKEDINFFYIEVSMHRPVFTLTGIDILPSVRLDRYGYFGNIYDAKETIKDSIDHLMDKFLVKWKEANKK
jgi:hypothetical protein